MVAAALAVGLGGGAGRLELLGQTFSGPQAPEVERAERDAQARDRDRDRDPAQLLASLSREQPREGGDAGPAPRPAGAPAAPDGGAPTVRVPSPSSGNAPAPGVVGPGSGPQTAPPAATPGAPAGDDSADAGKPGAIGQAGDQLSEVLEPVPGAGPPAAGLVDGVTGTLDEAVPIPRRPGAGTRSPGSRTRARR